MRIRNKEYNGIKLWFVNSKTYIKMKIKALLNVLWRKVIWRKASEEVQINGPVGKNGFK